MRYDAHVALVICAGLDPPQHRYALANPIGQVHAPQLLELIEQFLDDPLLDNAHRCAWGQLRARALEALAEPWSGSERDLG